MVFREDTLCKIASMHQFTQLPLDKAIPNRTTIMNFRHLLEKHKLTRKLFQTVNQWRSDWCDDDARNIGRCNDYSITKLH